MSLVRGMRGFVLAEIIVVLVISAVVVVALLGALVALVRGLQPPNVTIQGENLPIAPTFGAFSSAVRLHQTLTDRVTAARAVYVFGGRHLSIPAGAPAAAILPLKTQALPVIADFTPGLPMDAKDFYDRYASTLGDQDTTRSPDDFSLAVIGPSNGVLEITCFAQVRRSEVTISDGNTSTSYWVREVKLWDTDFGLQRYVFAEKPAQSNRVFVGAVHTWMRYRLNATAEEGPTCVVFPDPWIYAGARGMADDIPAFSRFSYFLAVSP